MTNKPLKCGCACAVLLGQRGTFDGTDHKLSDKTFSVPNHYHAVVVAFVEHTSCNPILENKTRCHISDS